MAKHRVLVLGGGFGGAYVARGLARAARRGDVDVTVLSRSPSFLFTPLLPEVATGGLSRRGMAVPLFDAASRAARVVVGEALSVDAAARVARADCADGCIIDLPYDTLVIALGARANFFGVPGAAEHALPLKTIADANRIRRAVTAAFERASRERRAPSFVVVGGGPTGVELSSELAELCRYSLADVYPEAAPAAVTLLSAVDDVLPMLKEKGRAKARAALSEAGVTVTVSATVTAVDQTHVTLANGERLAADVVVWAAGVSPAPLPEGLDLPLDKTGRVIVDGHLRVAARPEIFVLGDQAAGAPMLAQAATQQAPVVAAAIISTVSGRPLGPGFAFKSKGLLVSLGRWRAVGQIGSATVSGPFAWWLWRTVYLFKFPSFSKRARVALEWAIGLFFPRDISA